MKRHSTGSLTPEQKQTQDIPDYRTAIRAERGLIKLGVITEGTIEKGALEQGILTTEKLKQHYQFER